jgi:tartrate dehydratase alpha subunit/fumarate hydratase class I-like protein
MVDPPIGARRNTRDNTPAIIYTDIVPGDRLEIALAAKGGGSENKSVRSRVWYRHWICRRTKKRDLGKPRRISRQVS